MVTKGTTARSFDVKHKNPKVKNTHIYVEDTGEIKYGIDANIKSITWVAGSQQYLLEFKDPYMKVLSICVTPQITSTTAPIIVGVNNLQNTGILIGFGTIFGFSQSDFTLFLCYQDSSLPIVGDN